MPAYWICLWPTARGGGVSRIGWLGGCRPRPHAYMCAHACTHSQRRVQATSDAHASPCRISTTARKAVPSSGQRPILAASQCHAWACSSEASLEARFMREHACMLQRAAGRSDPYGGAHACLPGRLPPPSGAIHGMAWWCRSVVWCVRPCPESHNAQACVHALQAACSTCTC